MRILLKIGGAQLADGPSRAALAQAVRAARDAGHELAIVHGGGDQIRALGDRLGLQHSYHRGLRVTDAETAEVVLMVLGGAVNRRLVASLVAGGVPSIGLSGADGGLFGARKYAPDGVDLGFVGEIASTEPRILSALTSQGFVPVIATVAPLDASEQGDDSHFYNINADQAAAPLARAFRADALLFLTDVPGVLRDGALVPVLDPALGAELEAHGVIAGGMLPKVAAAFAAARENPDAVVKIAPAGAPNAVLAALADDVGTRFRTSVAKEIQPHG
ncbi:MAG: acetylglutamate kinase [Planctomycetota bacterium]|nr:MAG: acetylglutamate kinase [Planctomycetota bacterium]